MLERVRPHRRHAARLGGRRVDLRVQGACESSFVPPFEIRETIRQLFELGLRSAPLIAVSGMAVGVVLSMHTRASLERFGAEAMIPAGLAIALVRETGPLTAGLLLSGRIGAGIGAELGAMRVTEQIDALEASAVDSFRYLVVTRVVACIIALPILTTIMNFAGMLGGFLAETATTGMSLPLYFNRAFSIVDLTDYVPATVKTMVFGFIIATMSSYLGFTTESGTEGVGRASTRAVVLLLDADHRRERRPRAPDLLHLSKGSRRMIEAVAERSTMQSPTSEALPSVRLEHVSKSFGSRCVLDDVTLDVPAGCGFVILGRSGTGKSVLLRHIIGLVRPDSGQRVRSGSGSQRADRSGPRAGSKVGRVSVSERRALRLDLGRRERGVSRATPHAGSPTRRSESRAQQKLAAVGLEREYDKMPAALSGGMRKRAGLARAMALDPPILLVDEPSAGLDPITSDEIDALLLELKQKGGTTIIVVTHNIPSARRLGDELVMLHEGRILAQGTAADLDQSDNELVRAFMASSHSG